MATDNTTTNGYGLAANGSIPIDPRYDRVRRNTGEKLQRELDSKTLAGIQAVVRRGNGAIAERLRDLDKEWTIDRALITGAGINVLVSLTLGRTVHRAWYALPAVVAAFLIQFALQGWCPPLPVLRRLGFRSAKEVALERYALKALRGDFRSVAEENEELGINIDRAVAAAA